MHKFTSLMFGLFSKKPKHNRLDDKVYIVRSKADQALKAEFSKLKTENKNVFLLYFFENSLTRLRNEMDLGAIAPIKAEKIIRDIVTRSSVNSKESPIFLFVEHHPSCKLEEEVIAEIETVCEGNSPSLGFYTSLDEPMMKQFGSDKIIELMKKMGMNEDDVISHSMVTRSIRNAQEKIAKKVSVEIKANSQEEWMKVNLPK